MSNNLIIGKNSFVGKSLRKYFNGIYISSKEINDTKFNNFKNIILLSSPKTYKKKKINNFLFEKKVLKKISSQKLIFFSTSKIYPNKINCLESMQTDPQNFYAENKLKVEELLSKEHHNTLILRLSNIFDVDNINENTFLGLMHKNFFNKNRINFDISINSLKDFISMKSVKKVLKNIDNNKLYGVYNVGSQNGYKIKDIINFYFDSDVIKSTPINHTKAVKSQTLSIKKLSRLLKIKKNEFHLDTKNQLKTCKKFFS